MSDFATYINELYKSIETSDKPARKLEEILQSDAYEHSVELLNKEEGDGSWPSEEYASERLIVGNLVRYLQSLNEDEETFYQKLWEAIANRHTASNDSNKQAAILCLLGDQMLPYYQLDIVELNDEDFNERRNELLPSWRRLSAIFHRDYAHEFQKAHALLDVIEQREDPLDRALLLAFVLSEGDEE